MTTIAGATTYCIYLSTTKTGAEGSETPTGDIVYFYAEDYDRSVANLALPKPTIGGTFYIPTSKFSIVVTLKNVFIGPQGAITATTEADAIEKFLFDNSIKRGASGFYLFLYNEAETQYRKYAWTSSGTQVRTILCCVNGWNEEMGKGKHYILPSLKFTTLKYA